MTSTEMKADRSANRTGVYIAVLQLVFTLGWTTYVIYLPKLAASVGIAPSAVILILMLDQAIFTITDTAMGIAADKVATVCRQAQRCSWACSPRSPARPSSRCRSSPAPARARKSGSSC